MEEGEGMEWEMKMDGEKKRVHTEVQIMEKLGMKMVS